MNYIRFIHVFYCLAMTLGVMAQPILIDESIKAGELICFPLHGDSNSYRYLPHQGRLATNASGEPEFSYLRYVTPNTSAPVTGTKSISEADGGGLVHFLVLYETPEAVVQQAQNALRIKTKNPKAVLKGPVIFSKGDYLVISSVLGAGGKNEKKLIGTGQAPVFENSKVAFSFLLPVLEAKLLMESFKMNTPDVSIMFELVFSGLTQAYNAEMEVSWSEVQKSDYYHEKNNFLFVSSEVEKSFAELKKTGAMKLNTFGRDSILEPLLELAHEKLLAMMFDPMKPQEIPSESKKGFLEEVFGTGGLAGGGLFGFSRVYKLKELKTEGKTNISFTSRSSVDRKHLITFNIGGIYKKYGQDQRFFRDVTLDDPVFQQRQVRLSLDGDLKNAFDQVVKSASVSIRKTHQNGEVTLQEIFLTPDSLKNFRGDLSMIYLSKADKDRTQWLDYEYMVAWNFGNEGEYKTEWLKQNTPIINLYVPYKHHTIFLDGDLKALEAKGVKAVTIEVRFPFFGKTMTKRMNVRMSDDISSKRFDLTLPVDQHSVQYTVSWMNADRSTRQFEGEDQFGLILIDEL